MDTENIKEKGDNVTVYEVSYLLLPSLAQEQVPSRADAIKEQMTKLGGAIISFENPVLIDLAYPMTKVTHAGRTKVSSAYFGWIKFEITSEGIEKVKKALDADNEIVRHLIIKTVRENTLLNGKMKLQKEERKREEAEGEEVSAEMPKEAPEEDSDKNIDELVEA
jgi:ribosomal protein S6